MTYSTVINGVVLSEQYHYVTLFVQGDVDTDVKAEPSNLEPEKCQGWLCTYTDIKVLLRPSDNFMR